MILGSSVLWEPMGSAQLSGAWPPPRTFPWWWRYPQRSHPVLVGNPRGRGLLKCPVWPPPTPCWEKLGSRVHLEWVPRERGSLSLQGLQEQQLSHQGSHQPRGWEVGEAAGPSTLASPGDEQYISLCGCPQLGQPWAAPGPLQSAPGCSWDTIAGRRHRAAETPDLGRGKLSPTEPPLAQVVSCQPLSWGLLQTESGCGR